MVNGLTSQLNYEKEEEEAKKMHDKIVWKPNRFINKRVNKEENGVRSLGLHRYCRQRQINVENKKNNII